MITNEVLYAHPTIDEQIRSQGEYMRIHTAASIIAMLAASTLTTNVFAGQSASQADRDFVVKVSQGGLYEVEAGKIAALKGTVPVIKDFGMLESQDHKDVNAELHRIAAQTGVTIPPGLSPEFTQRLNKLKAVPAAQFDNFYISDMKQIHNKDEGLFQQEAKGGSPAYQTFAHNTAILVNAHLGWLNTL